MIVIHIGLRKAGSSSIQEFLSANAEALRGLGVDYPTMGRAGPAHGNLVHEIRGRHGFNPKNGGLSEIADYRRANGGGVLLFSSEHFEECDASEASRMKAALGRDGEAFRIILIIRDLIPLIPSAYAQLIRNGKTTFDFDRFFERRMRAGRADHFETAKTWAGVFGWENLEVRVLDRQYLLNGDLLDDFLTLLGIDPSDAGARALERPGIPNESPGWRVLEALRALYGGESGMPGDHALSAPLPDDRKLRWSLGKAAHKVGERLGWNADRGQYLTRPQAQRCLDTYGSAVTALNKALRVKLPEPLDLDARGFVEREFMPDATHIAPGELREFYDELAASISGRRRRPPRQRLSQ